LEYKTYTRSYRRLSARRHFEKTSASGGQPLHCFTDFEPDALRENARFTDPFSTSTPIHDNRYQNSPMFTWFLNRTVVIEVTSHNENAAPLIMKILDGVLIDLSSTSFISR
jgi:hypothetical protein